MILNRKDVIFTYYLFREPTKVFYFPREKEFIVVKQLLDLWYIYVRPNLVFLLFQVMLTVEKNVAVFVTRLVWCGSAK